jgi:short-subunit dehydrogenase
VNVLITGAGRGIGFELARQFDAGRHKVVALSRNKKHLQELASLCARENPSSGLVTCAFDLEKLDDIDTVFRDFIKDEFQELDILINNAGYLIRKDFPATDPGEMFKCLVINYCAPVRLIAACLPMLKKSDRAHVINIGSMGGYQGSRKFPGLSHYSSAKAALAVLTECLAEEFAGTSIRFNCLALGAVQTEMFASAFPEFRASQTAEGMASFIMDFAIRGYDYYNGKILPVSASTP